MSVIVLMVLSILSNPLGGSCQLSTLPVSALREGDITYGPSSSICQLRREYMAKDSCLAGRLRNPFEDGRLLTKACTSRASSSSVSLAIQGTLCKKLSYY